MLKILLEFGVLVFVETGKPENPDKNAFVASGEQTQRTCDARFWNRTRATAVGHEGSHHCACAIPAPLLKKGQGTNEKVRHNGGSQITKMVSSYIYVLLKRTTELYRTGSSMRYKIELKVTHIGL